MIQSRIVKKTKTKKNLTLERSPLNDTEQIRMDPNYFHFLCCSWSHHFQGDTWFNASEFLSTTLKGNWVIAGFDRSEHTAAQRSYAPLSSLLWDRARRSLLHQLQHRSPLTVDPSGSTGTLGDTLVTIVPLYCLVSFYQWLRESRENLTTFWAMAVLWSRFGEKTLWEVNTHCCLEVIKSSAPS